MKIYTNDIIVYQKLNEVMGEAWAYISSNLDLHIKVWELYHYEVGSWLHSDHVARLNVLLGIKAGASNHILVKLAIAGLLHDIGKIKVPLDILKKPDMLTDREFAIVKKHPTYSRNILQLCHVDDEDIIDIVYQHHERKNGEGYPEGRKDINFNGYCLQGLSSYYSEVNDLIKKMSGIPDCEDIPNNMKINVLAHITSVSDVFAALLNPRSYKPSKTVKQALDIMKKESIYLPELLTWLEEICSITDDNALVCLSYAE